MQDSSLTSTAAASGRRLWLVGGIALIVVALGVGAYFAVRAFLRPSAATASAMPAETRFYASLDLLQLLDEGKLARLAAVFKDSLTASNVQFDRAGVADQIDIWLQQRYDFDFSNDIAPWLGRSVGVGVVGLQTGAQGEPAPTALIAALEVRDTGAADAFLQKLLAQLEQDSGQAATVASYQDAADYYQLGAGEEMISIGRQARLMLVTRGADAMPLALEALSGEALADSADFSDVVASLPSERVVTLFFSRDFFPQLLSLTSNQIESLPLNAALSDAGLDGMRGAAAGIGLTEPGITLDLVTLLDPAATPVDRVQTAGSGALAALMPAETVLFINGGSWNGLWQGVRRSMVAGASESDVADAMQIFEQSVGFNPDTELFPYLTGELAVALAPTTQGLIAEGTGLGLSVLLSSGIDDAAALIAVGDKFQAYAEFLAGAPLITKTTVGARTLYTTIPAFSPLDLGYAISPDLFVLGTPASAVQALDSADTNHLIAAPLYSRAQTSLGAPPTFFLDIHGMLGSLPAELDASELSSILTNVPMIAATGDSSSTDRTARWVIFLDTPAE